jgi:diguanylate cyclase (GGDEF)-like protein/PAS domain S-box-containing protein
MGQEHPGEGTATAEERLAAQYAVAQVLAAGGPPGQAVPRILEAVGELLGWHFGALWRIDERGEVMQCAELWHAKGVPAIGFSSLTRNAAFRRGDGFPGLVWESGEPLWVEDMVDRTDLPRASVAARDGLHAGVATPVALEGEIMGVIEFFSDGPRPRDDAMIDLIRAVGNQLGQFLVRREAEQRVQRSEARKSAIVKASLDAIITIDAAGRAVEWNPSAERMFGFDRETAIGRPIADLIVPPELRDRHQRGIADLLTGREPRLLGRRVELIAVRAGGERFPVEVALTQVDLPGPPLFTGYVRDITERVRAERAARDLAAIVESSDDAIVSKALDGTILTWNKGAEQLYGYMAEEAVGRPASILAPPERADELPQILDAVRRGERVSQFETVRMRKDGSLVEVSLSVSPILGQYTQVVAASVIAHDITDRRRAEAQIAHLAFHDPLTGLPNRLMFQEHLDVALARAARGGLGVAVLFIDLDDFKLVNDSFGHEAGDRLLRDFGTRLRAVTRATDIVARQGGDEFLVLVPDLELTDGPGIEPRALEVVQSIETKVRSVLDAPFSVAGSDVNLGLSIGVSIYPIDARDRHELLRNADTAMYIGKGRGRPAFHPESADARGRLATIQRLRRAIDRDELVLYHQPLIELATGRVLGVEALLRWNDPSTGTVTPADFIPLAEHSGLIEPITNWVIAAVCRQAREWEESGHELLQSFNLPPSLWTPSMIARVIEAAKAESVPTDRLMIEITESTAMVQPGRVAQVLASIRSSGLRLAIDDFGSGYSSLSRLRQMPVETLKIDRSFVADLPNDPGAAAIVTTIIDLARSLGIRSLAEGIETEEQRAFLVDHGCELGQGYLLGRPAPADELDVRPRTR